MFLNLRKKSNPGMFKNNSIISCMSRGPNKPYFSVLPPSLLVLFATMQKKAGGEAKAVCTAILFALPRA